MRAYRRWWQPGGTYFFTLVIYRRREILTTPLARRCLRDAVAEERTNHPFALDAVVLLPDHLHLILTLPAGDEDYAARVGRIKAGFTRGFLDAGGGEARPSPGMERGRHRGVWQPRFWEHLIADERDLEQHEDYVHYSPVRHGLAACPHEWEWSSFRRLVDAGRYETSWACCCGEDRPPPPKFPRVSAKSE